MNNGINKLKKYIAALSLISINILFASNTTFAADAPGDTVLNTPGKPAVVKPGVFSIAVIPDSQYYLAQAQLGGTFDMFKAQIDWIQKNQEKENIAYVAHMGYITDHGDTPMTTRSE